MVTGDTSASSSRSMRAVVGVGAELGAAIGAVLGGGVAVSAVPVAELVSAAAVAGLGSVEPSVVFGGGAVVGVERMASRCAMNHSRTWGPSP
jgi:hypothetical protein